MGKWKCSSISCILLMLVCVMKNDRIDFCSTLSTYVHDISTYVWEFKRIGEECVIDCRLVVEEIYYMYIHSVIGFIFMFENADSIEGNGYREKQCIRVQEKSAQLSANGEC